MNLIKYSRAIAKLHLLPFNDIKVVPIISLVNDMLINFDCPFKHGIEDLRKLFLQGTHKEKRWLLHLWGKKNYAYPSW